MKSSQKPGKKLDTQTWITAVSEQQLPILRATLHSFSAIVDDERSSTMRLTQAILQDAALTTRILRAANSSFYNPSGRTVSTVSRSLILLGTDLLKSIALSIAILDTVLCAELNERASQVSSRAFHAAVQARALAVVRGDPAPEEAFIAALLLPIGELAFWCFSDGLGLVADEALKQGMSLSQVEEEVIGCRFQRLTSELAREWKLNASLLEVLQDPQGRQPRIQSVRQGHEIALLAERHGWSSPETMKFSTDLATALHRDVEEVQKFLQENARAADELLRQHGFVGPDPGQGQAEIVEAREAAPVWLPADPALQLRILRELTQVFSDDSPLQMVLEMVMEGLFRGLGLDRVVFAVLSADKQVLQIRYVLDAGNPQADTGQKIPLRAGGELQAHLDRAACIWQKQVAPLAARDLGLLAGPSPANGYFLGPAIIRGKTIGAFYGDRQASGRALDEDSFEGFKLFVQQARLGLEHKQRPGRGG
ncbi:HDOD domain-containing protein [Thermithiobacillus plumbiphilus]|uniref:HDOD domain-containing protein n=1 Tax=Thermithiobacillus plumbiphilus TaxID=1729899 RepID=A0ABU9D7I3_9PROT